MEEKSKLEYDPVAALSENRDLSDDELIALLEGTEFDSLLIAEADRIRRENYGDRVFLRGLIEFTNYCKNDCYYCGIRRGNVKLDRYRLDEETILTCCRKGYDLGFRTFVLQGGEDPHFTDEILCPIVSGIRTEFPDCAITLSAGERSRSSYEKLFEAGANRYLLRHEAASERLYSHLHPEEMSLENRMQCLRDLKDIGYQVGSGFMVGPPGQTLQDLVTDLRFLQSLDPDMIGIGPYIHHYDTLLGGSADGSLELTLRMIAVLRLMFPWALIPSTTALASLDPRGRTLGLQAGANVIMPNLSPPQFRDSYSIYNNKKATGLESAEGLEALNNEVASAGYRIVTDRGDVVR